MNGISLGAPRVIEHAISTGDGWTLTCRQVYRPDRLDTSRRPFVIIPGYGMNIRAFAYGHGGASLERAITDAGYEFWSADMRWQGGSTSTERRPAGPSMEDFAGCDLPAVLAYVQAHTQSARSRVTLAGCSLGGSIICAYLARYGDGEVGAFLSMCSPLRWISVPPIFRVLFAAPRLVGRVPTRGTASLARVALPIVGRLPHLLDVYANPHNIAFEDVRTLTQAVSDPSPTLNAEIAHWVRRRDLELWGMNVTHRMEEQTCPLLVVSANRDGLVPPTTSRFIREVWGGDDIDEIRVGNARNWYGHADVFIGKNAHRDTFEPVIRWLNRHAS